MVENSPFQNDTYFTFNGVPVSSVAFDGKGIGPSLVDGVLEINLRALLLDPVH